MARVCVRGEGGECWGVCVTGTYVAYLSGHCVGGEVPPRYCLHSVIRSPRVLCVLAICSPLLYAGVGSRSC